MRKMLVGAQVALSLLLLIGAGLFLRTLTNLRSLGPGFSTGRLVTFSVDPSLSGYSDEPTRTFYRRLTEDLRATPGVTSVGLASVPILVNWEWRHPASAEGYLRNSGPDPVVLWNQVSSDYFATLGISILKGRTFTDRDTNAPSGALINETFARKFFPGRDPIGLHIGFGANVPTNNEVIGIVKDTKYRNLRDEIPPQVFYTYLTSTHFRGMTVYLRTSTAPAQLIGTIRETVRHLDPNIPVFNLLTTDEVIDNSLKAERLVASLSTVFSGLATLLAMVGLYGVMAYIVARRTREIGLRIALGALQGNVLWMVMREVLILIGTGIAVGMPLALALSSLVRNQLYGLAPHDPLTLVASTSALTLVACLAGFIPAFRASRVDPLNALRHE